MYLIDREVFHLFWAFGAFLSYVIFVWNRDNDLLSPTYHTDNASFLMWMIVNAIAWPLILAIILIIVSVTWIKKQYQKHTKHSNK